MSYSIVTTDTFDKQVERLEKKFSSLKQEISDFKDKITEDPFIGVSYGDGLRKVRLAIKSKGKGKSGGARIIYTIVYFEDVIILLRIEDKSEVANVTKKEVQDYLKAKGIKTKPDKIKKKKK